MRNLARITLATAALAMFATPVTADHIKDGRKLNAALDGPSEVPGPGDPDGMGMFVSRTNPGTGQICYTLTVMNIATPTAAHIHRGAEGAAGPPVVTLDTPTTGESSACAAIPRNLARAIIRNPEQYYVNVHNAEFPPGAVRGQLSKK